MSLPAQFDILMMIYLVYYLPRYLEPLSEHIYLLALSWLAEKVHMIGPNAGRREGQDGVCIGED